MESTITGSFFRVFHRTSEFAGIVFKEKSEYIIIQIQEVKDGYFLAEVIKK